MAGSLQDYERKRDFARTTEPRPARPTAGPAGQGVFVVQKHAARRLHYDLRLELDGVLKSWAVTRGPSLDPADKRLAVHTEDHPMKYRDFEGTIPRGAYGGGTMMVWDQGTWRFTGKGDPAEAYAKGRLEFELDGTRLRGAWKLVRMGGKAAREGKDNWLLIKSHDDAARPGDGDVLVVEETTSARSGRTMDEIGGAAEAPAKKPAAPKKAKKTAGSAAVPPAGDLAPQLCSLAPAPPQGEGWLHEIKFDGYRVLVRLEDGVARVLTRNGKDWTDRFAALARAVEALPTEAAVLDGEVVVLDEAGLSSFALLQQALSDDDQGAMALYAFDLLHLDGEDLRRLPLVERKQRLRALLPEDGGMLRYSDHIDGAGGEEVLTNACSMALEGIVSKRRDAPYTSGRGKAWVKSKCVERQEFVIGGYVPPSKKGPGIGALALGTYEDGALTYAGKVGTGYTAKVSAELRVMLDGRVRKSSPFADLPAPEQKGMVFVRPDMVCEVEFLSWSRDGLIRQGSFQGLREDKDPRDIRRESAGKLIKGRSRAVPASAPDTIAGVTLSNPDKVLYPDMGLTKRGLAVFVESVGDRLLRELADRPLSLVRCPDGPGGQCFFQRHAFKGLPEGVESLEIGGAKGSTLVVRDLHGLIGLVQLGVLEFHPWGCRIDDSERPDRMIFDMDPDEGLPFAAVREAAWECRQRLLDAGLESFVKVTGGKGLHVVVPLSRRQDWPQVKAFARAVAEGMAADAPSRYVATMTKAKRKGKVFVDFFRNDRSATAVAAWSTRARAGAPVAVPVAWEELDRLERADRFTVESLPRRLARVEADPWEDMGRVRQSLTKKAMKSVGL